MTTIVTLLALCVSNPPPTQEERLELIGFSEHEDAAAWRVRVTRQTPDGETDRYSVIRIVDTKSGDVVGHIRQGRARRTDRLGRPARLASAERIASENPMWQDALPASAWRKARRKIRFKKKPVKVKDGALRFLPDGDAFMTLGIDNDTLRVVSDPGSPIGLTPRARLYDGSDFDLGHIRVAGRANRIVEAKIRVWHSPSGQHVAYEVELDSSTPGHERHMEYGKVLRLPRSRLGVTTIGTMNVLSENFEVSEDLFSDMHPEIKGLYKAYVGRWD